MPERLEIVISGDARALIAELKKSGVEIKQFTGKTEGAEAGTAGWRKEVGALGRELGAGLALGTVAKGVGDFIVSSAQASDQARQARSAFTHLSGGAAEAADNMAALSRATTVAGRQVVDQTTRMQIANQLLGMRIANTAGELEEVVYVARRLGGEFKGLGAKEAAEEFAIMMSNMSVARLDSFGISSGRVKQRIDELMASTEGMTHEQAFFQATMEEARATLARLGPELETQKQAAEASAASWSDFKVAFGDMLLTVGNSSGTFDLATSAVNQMAAGAKSWEYMFTTTGQLLRGETTPAVQEMTDAVGGSTAKLQENADAHAMTAEEIKKHEDAARNMALTQAGFINEMNDLEADRLEREQEFNKKREEVRGNTNERIKENEKQKNDALTELFAQFQDAQNQARLSGNSQAIGQLENRYEEEKQKTIAHYDELNQGIRDKRDEQLRDMVAAQNKQAEEQRKHIEDLKLKTTLGILEAEGKLEDLVGFAGVSADDAFDLIKAGVININSDLARGISEANTKLTQSSGDYKAAEQQNQALVRDALSKTVGDYKILEDTSKRVSDQVQSDVKQNLRVLSASEVAGLRQRASLAGKTPNTPSFAGGGVIPGPVGAPIMVEAHGGETVLNPSQLGEIVRVLQQSLQVQGMTMQQMALMSRSEAVRPGSTDFGRNRLLPV